MKRGRKPKHLSDLVGTGVVSRLLRVSAPTVRAYAARGLIPAPIFKGRRRYWTAEWVLLLVQAGATASSPLRPAGE